ncbi:hypothetical protein Hanom_Chr09g00811231 [Helianthus anomalus]
MERGRGGRPNEDCNGPHKNRGWQLCREVSAKTTTGRGGGVADSIATSSTVREDWHGIATSFQRYCQSFLQNMYGFSCTSHCSVSARLFEVVMVILDSLTV